MRSDLSISYLSWTLDSVSYRDHTASRNSASLHTSIIIMLRKYQDDEYSSQSQPMHAVFNLRATRPRLSGWKRMWQLRSWCLFQQSISCVCINFKSRCEATYNIWLSQLALSAVHEVQVEGTTSIVLLTVLTYTKRWRPTRASAYIHATLQAKLGNFIE